MQWVLSATQSCKQMRTSFRAGGGFASNRGCRIVAQIDFRIRFRDLRGSHDNDYYSRGLYDIYLDANLILDINHILERMGTSIRRSSERGVAIDVFYLAVSRVV
nr:hypothetical protein CFP56_65877 [Quercus suber]